MVPQKPGEHLYAYAFGAVRVNAFGAVRVNALPVIFVVLVYFEQIIGDSFSQRLEHNSLVYRLNLFFKI